MLQSAQDDLPAFFNYLWNLQKSLEVFGCLRKISEICRKVLKITSQHFLKFFWKSSEIVRNLRKKFGKCRKVLKTIFQLFENFRKFSEMFGTTRKFFKCNRRFMKIFYTIPISDTFGLKIRFKNFICNLHWYYAFCTDITLFALALLFNCTALSQSESSNFFMFVIIYKTFTCL